MTRAQVPLSMLEAAIGAVLVLTVVLGFALGVPAPDTTTPQLETYAHDTATILANEPPQHGGATRLREVVASNASFQRERRPLRRRVDRILTDNLMFRVETPHGAVGFHRPNRVQFGSATVTTEPGAVRIEVWYA